MAALGGIVLASRLSSVDTNAGGGSILLYSIAAAVIGGTSAVRRRAATSRARILGALVIASIDNGLGLLERQLRATKFVVTGVRAAGGGHGRLALAPGGASGRA